MLTLLEEGASGLPLLMSQHNANMQPRSRRSRSRTEAPPYGVCSEHFIALARPRSSSTGAFAGAPGPLSARSRAHANCMSTAWSGEAPRQRSRRGRRCRYSVRPPRARSSRSCRASWHGRRQRGGSSNRTPPTERLNAAPSPRSKPSRGGTGSPRTGLSATRPGPPASTPPVPPWNGPWGWSTSAPHHPSCRGPDRQAAGGHEPEGGHGRAGRERQGEACRW